MPRIRTSRLPRSSMPLTDLAIGTTPTASASEPAWPADAMNSLIVGEAMHRLSRELYPLRRSLTGEGLRETLRRVGELIPLTVTETPSGTQVFDWTVPQEGNIREAWIADA